VNREIAPRSLVGAFLFYQRGAWRRFFCGWRGHWPGTDLFSRREALCVKCGAPLI
jgi:hypothetical protein